MARDPYKYFRIEAHELVGELAKGLLVLERGPDPEVVARLLRHAHTLKGAARIVRHRGLSDLAHAMEDALAPLRDAAGTQRLDGALAIVDRMTAELAALDAPPAPERPAPRADDVPALPPRADTSAIDDALAGLATAHALLARARGASDPRTAARDLEHADRELREVRRDIEQLRLATAAAMFTSLERAARDAALAQGKRVAFAGHGADVRFDAQLLPALHGALVQLVRNAVVHGIEPPSERSAARKPTDGRVTITVSSLGRRIAFTCEDDGRGLDVAAIRRAAQQRGIGDAGDDPSQLFRLLLAGGISTSRAVDELAGRGIGLDVVREAAESLGGEVSVRTRPGEGCAITLVVPVSLSATTLLRVTAADRTVAIPQPAVRRLARFRPGEVVRSGDRAMLYLDDVGAPCAPLASLLGVAGGAPTTVVYVDGAGVVAAVLVDAVLGIEDAVVRAVPAKTPIDAIVYGMAIDAMGHPYAVLEPGALVAGVRGARAPTAVAQPAAPAPILVVDDSLTTRMLEQSILESAGFAVELATSAEEALDKLAHRSYALLLVDVEMPGMDGFALIATMRGKPALASVPAILVTSRDAADDRRRGTAVGAQGYVVKSQFDQGELLALIRRLVRA